MLRNGQVITAVDRILKSQRPVAGSHYLHDTLEASPHTHHQAAGLFGGMLASTG